MRFAKALTEISAIFRNMLWYQCTCSQGLHPYFCLLIKVEPTRTISVFPCFEKIPDPPFGEICVWLTQTSRPLEVLAAGSPAWLLDLLPRVARDLPVSGDEGTRSN
jgi:hypothetical protein